MKGKTTQKFVLNNEIIKAIFVIGMICCPGFSEILNLEPLGKPRSIQGPIFGASTTAFYERLLEDPEKVEVLKTMKIGLDRFPGGSDSNFYNWRTGLIEIAEKSDSSAYVKFWVKAAANIAHGKPNGVSLEEFEPFSRKIGAQTIIVPNLESSSVIDQVEWFKQLSKEGIVPKRIELGNEFWVAMGNDPTSLARWPDEPASMRIMKQYLDAIKPYLPSGSKIAVQAAAGAIETQKGKFGQRLKQWDLDLHPEPWFDAVTMHLYPRLRDIMNDQLAGATAPTKENALIRLNAMMARVDEGIDREIKDIEQRVPGKEIWITEWNGKGTNPEVQRGNIEPLSPAMEMLATSRMALVYLRHQSITASLYFMLNFRKDPHYATFISNDQDSYSLVPAAVTIRWLNDSSNTSDTFQRLVQKEEKLIQGGGVQNESFFPVEGGLFESSDRTILLLQNASSLSYSLDPRSLIKDKTPVSADILVTRDLADTKQQSANVEKSDIKGPILIPPYSFTRIIWDKK